MYQQIIWPKLRVFQVKPLFGPRKPKRKEIKIWFHTIEPSSCIRRYRMEFQSNKANPITDIWNFFRCYKIFSATKQAHFGIIIQIGLKRRNFNQIKQNRWLNCRLFSFFFHVPRVSMQLHKAGKWRTSGH